jgi:site-specific DNA-methyltransferase (cytosine-N4-specific)
VLDPFGGTGTTALVAAMLGRRGISIDLSADYCRLAQWRATDPKERARAAGTDASKVERPAPEQADLFGASA